MKIPVIRIPKHLKASSPKGLEVLMLKNNARLGYGVEYFDFSYDTNTKKWVCWYVDSHNSQILSDQIIEAENIISQDEGEE